jgi:two-component system sensor histidine kinase CpxA
VERFGQGDLSTRFETARRDELGDLARTFNRMADRIQTLLAAERRLLLDISHELRSPLARLGVAAELARSGEDRGGALDRIQKEADRLNSLVGELLQVTRAEGDPASLHFEPVRLDELVRDIVETNRIEATARGSELKLDIEAAAQIQGKPELLRRAVENVIRNAIRHAPAGTAVEVTVKERSILVRDRGPGVPEQDLARIFDPFYRVENDRNRSSGGAGLGLAIARRAIELHKGTIRARNADPGLLVEFEFLVKTRSEGPSA